MEEKIAVIERIRQHCMKKSVFKPHLSYRWERFGEGVTDGVMTGTDANVRTKGDEVEKDVFLDHGVHREE